MLTRIYLPVEGPIKVSFASDVMALDSSTMVMLKPEMPSTGDAISVGASNGVGIAVGMGEGVYVGFEIATVDQDGESVVGEALASAPARLGINAKATHAIIARKNAAAASEMKMLRRFRF